MLAQPCMVQVAGEAGQADALPAAAATSQLLPAASATVTSLGSTGMQTTAMLLAMPAPTEEPPPEKEVRCRQGWSRLPPSVVAHA